MFDAWSKCTPATKSAVICHNSLDSYGHTGTNFVPVHTYLLDVSRMTDDWAQKSSHDERCYQ
jgi:hypothetical protein